MAESKPLVSVIIIFLNEEKFIKEAIESVFAQSYTHWELLLADDGSTDNSTHIAKSYAAQYPGQVRYLEHEGHENRGMSATRNLGIRHTRGTYVAFLDGDDVWLPHKLEQQIELMEKYPDVPLLYGRTQYWLSWLPENPCRVLYSLAQNDPDPLSITSRKFDTLIEPPTQLLLHLQDPNIYPCSCSMLFRRFIFDEVGYFEEQFRNANEDMVMHSKIFLKYPVYVSSECWDRYRIHPDSFWRTASLEGRGKEVYRTGRINYLDWLKSYLQEKEVADPQVWRRLNRAYIPFRYPILYRLFEIARHPFSLSVRLFRKLKKGYSYT